MGIVDLFSKRQRRARGEVPDVYQYDALPPELRAQAVHILGDLFGPADRHRSQSDRAFEIVHDLLCREYGRFRLSKKFTGSGYWRQAVFDFLMTAPTEEALDGIEIAFRLGSTLSRDYGYSRDSQPQISAEEAISELNQRFKERGIGFGIDPAM